MSRPFARLKLGRTRRPLSEPVAVLDSVATSMNYTDRGIDRDQNQQPKRLPALPAWAILENWQTGAALRESTEMASQGREVVPMATGTTGLRRTDQSRDR